MKNEKNNKKIFIILSIVIFGAAVLISLYNWFYVELHPDPYGLGNLAALSFIIYIPGAIFIIICLWILYGWIYGWINFFKINNLKKAKKANVFSVVLICLIVAIITGIFRHNYTNEKNLYTYENKVKSVCSEECKKIYSLDNFKKSGIYENLKTNELMYIKDSDSKKIPDEDMKYADIYYYLLGATTDKYVEKYFTDSLYFIDYDTDDKTTLDIILNVNSKEEFVNKYQEKLYEFFKEYQDEIRAALTINIYYTSDFNNITNENILFLLGNRDYKKNYLEKKDFSPECVNYDYVDDLDGFYPECYYADPTNTLKGYFADNKEPDKLIQIKNNKLISLDIGNYYMIEASKEEFANKMANSWI